MDDKLSYLSLATPIKHLRVSGIYRLEESSPKIHRFFHTIYMRTVFCLFLLYTSQQMLKVVEVRSDVDKVMNTMFLLLTHFDCIYKVVVLWKKADQIEGFLNVMKGPIFNQGKQEHAGLLLNTIQKTVLILRIFNGTALFTCMLWAIHPTILHIQEKHMELQIWLPFEANSNPQFYVVVVYIWIVTSWVAFCNTTIDIFISFSFEQCKTQVSILRADIQNLVEESKKEAQSSYSDFNTILERRFCKIVIHHKEIVATVNKIRDIFSGALFYQFLVSSWILCTSAYRMVNVNPASVEFVSMITYTMCILTELLFFCYYGNEITLESSNLTDSAYSMDWLEMPKPVRKSLIIFMERIKRPIEPMAGSFVPLSNSTFVSILRSSYSFYAFLKNSRR